MLNKSEILIKLLQEYYVKNARDVQPILKDLFVATIKEILEAELNNHLVYSRYDYNKKKTNNIRNGYQSKKVLRIYNGRNESTQHWVKVLNIH